MHASGDERLTVAQCRTLVGAACTLSDEALLALRDNLYGLAHAGVAAFRDARATSLALDNLPAESREDVEERAAILEFEARVPRVHAEQIALTQKRSHRRQ